MQDENPYQSPMEPCDPGPMAIPQSVFPASEGARFVNLILDQLACYALSYGVGYAIALTARALGTLFLVHQIPQLLFGVAVVLIYYVPQEALCGKTLAKFVTGTRVVAASGVKPTFGQIVGRTFCRMIPFEAFSFLQSNPVGWHDRFSGTRVIKDR
jgi:uncharacterized RDD family membrane protein YckC